VGLVAISSVRPSPVGATTSAGSTGPSVTSL
jgi:hypothetical protein